MQHAPMSRARYVQEKRKMRFQEAYDGWSEERLTQNEAAPYCWANVNAAFAAILNVLRPMGLRGCWTSDCARSPNAGPAVLRLVGGRTAV